MSVVQAWYNGSSEQQEMLVSVDNYCPEGTENKSVTYLIREALEINFHVRRSEYTQKSP